MLASQWNRKSVQWIACLCALALGGCKVGPDFQPPVTNVPAQFNWASQATMQGPPANFERWWLHFNDQHLDCLAQQSLAQNLSLKEAGARVLEARARRGIAAGMLFPQQQSLDANYSHAQASRNVANFFSVPGIFEPDLFPENFQVDLAMSWELDFWGKYRRSVEAADAQINATIALYDGARVLLLAEIARNYIQMRLAESELILARKNLEVQQSTLKLAENRKEGGLGSGLDVDQANINVGSTRATIPLLETARLQASYRICALLGRAPIDLSGELGFTGAIPVPSQNICFGIPADLLRRRPDVREAEFQLAAQSAKIGIAQSDFYPHISLNGRIGYSAQDFNHLFDSKSGTGLISPNFSWNLLNYGRIKFNVEAEQAAFQALCNNYYNTVVKAAQEAETAQVAYVLSHQRIQGLEQAVDSAKKAVEKSEKLYTNGSIDFGRVYILQAGLLDRQDAFVQTQASIALNLVEIFRSLGGGWEHVECSAASLAGLTASPQCQVANQLPPGQTGHSTAGMSETPMPSAAPVQTDQVRFSQQTPARYTAWQSGPVPASSGIPIQNYPSQPASQINRSPAVPNQMTSYPANVNHATINQMTSHPITANSAANYPATVTAVPFNPNVGQNVALRTAQMPTQAHPNSNIAEGKLTAQQLYLKLQSQTPRIASSPNQPTSITGSVPAPFVPMPPVKR